MTIAKTPHLLPSSTFFFHPPANFRRPRVLPHSHIKQQASFPKWPRQVSRPVPLLLLLLAPNPASHPHPLLHRTAAPAMLGMLGR